jgi:glucose/arabinose dehydrogenase
MTVRLSARRLTGSLGLLVVLAACTSSPPDLPPTAPVSVVPAPAPTPEPEQDPEPAPGETPDLTVSVTLTRVAELRTPIAAAVGPDGTFYVAEREGTVRPLTAAEPGSPVLDISAETTTDGERGLLGLAFAADGSELYISFTDTDGDTVIDSVAVEDGVVVADSRRTVFAYPQPFQNHNGGDLQIGPDGLLYIGLGDGGGGGDPVGAGQDPSIPLGALLRIDPVAAEPYGVPEDNPFVGDPEAAAEIWAYGLRNPWRFSFDRLTGDLWIADVGQDSREEINWMPAGEGAGANYGWNLMEGPSSSRTRNRPTMSRRSTNTRPPGSAVRSPAGTCTAAMRYPSCPAPTCSATTAKVPFGPSWWTRTAPSPTKPSSVSEATPSCHSLRTPPVSSTFSMRPARSGGSTRPDAGVDRPPEPGVASS